MKASDFRTKRYLLGYVTPCGEKIYSEAFRTKRELCAYQSSEFHQWRVNHFANLSFFVEYHDRRGFVASEFDFITSHKYSILAAKRVIYARNIGNKTTFHSQLNFVRKHKAYFGEAIAENSIDEMRSIPV